ncbi:efflux RND transporter periplasmic adaptor subunit [Aphanothece hegewaldii CCALA 016]|uniref:Efflux RND transporter periplasmic adaptor subunit n=1 Tax=Aphanothece hegewaldii CCALA 016 TaxID=2107694 RepID=A0A2T1LSS2_9CHRO|nr:efflux RND transporter periplasmic adaptor subunit [Aphanothece hegewaldii]PSF32941.1 efflux RND transporter periplasmic adaptor subunit [Aphanothece hegewaldii CCALA 016]
MSKTLTFFSATFLNLILLTTPAIVLAHGGHGDEFQGSGESNQTTEAIQVDAQTAKQMGIKVEPVKRQRLSVGIKTTGQIETLPNRQVEVTAPTSGKVVELLVKPGDLVKAGQSVAVVAAPELVELRVTATEKQAEAEADVEKAKADLKLAQENLIRQRQIAQAEIVQASTEVRVSQEKYDRDRELYEAGALPRRDFLESQAHLAQGKAQLTTATSSKDVLEAENQLKRAQSDLEVAQTRLRLSNEAYQSRLQQIGTRANDKGLVVVTAPITGRVVDREVSIGQTFQDAGGRLMTIVNDDRIFITANIYEQDLAKIRKGQRVNAKIASLAGKVFTGRITLIGSNVEGETRVVPVKAELDNTNGLLKLGMFAELEVLMDRSSTNTLAIPTSAVVEANGKQLVYLQNGDAFQPVEVRLGQTSDQLVEVKSGLFEDDLIVTQRAPQLYAQSLKGGIPSAESDEKEVSSPTKDTVTNSEQLPLWLVIPIGTAMIGGTFWAGSFWQSRRQSKIIPVEPKNTSQYETEIYLNSSSSSNSSTKMDEQAYEES